MIKLPQNQQLIPLPPKISQHTSLAQTINQERHFAHPHTFDYMSSDLFAVMSQFSKKSENFTPEKNKNCREKTQICHSEQQSLLQPQAHEQNKKARSVFQNFQKHLITTLKTRIVLQQNFKNDPTVHLAQRMWNTFLQTNYYSKKILHFLLGVKSIIDPRLKPTVHPNFYSIASVYPKEEIEQAQEYLREQIVQQGYKLKGRDILKNRRMCNSQQFCLYFQKFIQQLQNGGISRRLSKGLKNSDWKHIKFQGL